MLAASSIASVPSTLPSIGVRTVSPPPAAMLDGLTPSSHYSESICMLQVPEEVRRYGDPMHQAARS